MVTIEADFCDQGCVSNGAFICKTCLLGSKYIKGFCIPCGVSNCLKCEANIVNINFLDKKRSIKIIFKKKMLNHFSNF